MLQPPSPHLVLAANLLAPAARSRYTVGPNNKNPPKIRFIKFVKLTGYTYACNSLTNFESEVHAMTRNGNQVNLLKLAWQNS